MDKEKGKNSTLTFDKKKQTNKKQRTKKKHGGAKCKNSILSFQKKKKKKNSKGKGNGKNSYFWNFTENHIGKNSALTLKKQITREYRQKDKNSILTFQKRSYGKAKGKDWILTFEKKSHMVRQKVKTLFFLYKIPRVR